MWDVAQYEKFRSERSRPFYDLLARVPAAPFARIVDVGCGSGDLTETLCERWPEAHVTGLDSSDEMLAAAASRGRPGRLDFVKGDAASFRGGPFDLVLSNAAFQWISDHAKLLRHWSAQLSPNGVLAVQMPANFDQPSHVILAELTGVSRPSPVRPPDFYVRELWQLGLSVDAWETTYLHVLEGEDAVLEWMKGTGLRPVLARLDAAQQAAFLATYAARLREAYPPSPNGTLFPFKRLFFVAKNR